MRRGSRESDGIENARLRRENGEARAYIVTAREREVRAGGGGGGEREREELWISPSGNDSSFRPVEVLTAVNVGYWREASESNEP